MYSLVMSLFPRVIICIYIYANSILIQSIITYSSLTDIRIAPGF